MPLTFRCLLWYRLGSPSNDHFFKHYTLKVKSVVVFILAPKAPRERASTVFRGSDRGGGVPPPSVGCCLNGMGPLYPTSPTFPWGNLPGSKNCLFFERHLEFWLIARYSDNFIKGGPTLVVMGRDM